MIKKSINKTKIELITRKLAGYIIILSAFLLFAYFTDKILQAIFITLCYTSMRWLFPKTFHTTPYLCILISIFSMIFCISNSWGINISILSSCLIGLVFDYLLYKLQDYMDLQKEIKSLEHLKGSNMTMEKIEHIFKLHKTMEKYKPYLVATLVYKIRDVDYFRNEELLDNFIIDTQQYRNYKYKFMKFAKNINIL